MPVVCLLKPGTWSNIFSVFFCNEHRYSGEYKVVSSKELGDYGVNYAIMEKHNIPYDTRAATAKYTREFEVYSLKDVKRAKKMHKRLDLLREVIFDYPRGSYFVVLLIIEGVRKALKQHPKVIDYLQLNSPKLSKSKLTNFIKELLPEGIVEESDSD